MQLTLTPETSAHTQPQGHGCFTNCKRYFVFPVQRRKENKEEERKKAHLKLKSLQHERDLQRGRNEEQNRKHQLRCWLWVETWKMSDSDGETPTDSSLDASRLHATAPAVNSDGGVRGRTLCWGIQRWVITLMKGSEQPLPAEMLSLCSTALCQRRLVSTWQANGAVPQHPLRLTQMTLLQANTHFTHLAFSETQESTCPTDVQILVDFRQNVFCIFCVLKLLRCQSFVWWHLPAFCVNTLVKYTFIIYLKCLSHIHFERNILKISFFCTSMSGISK